MRTFRNFTLSLMAFLSLGIASVFAGGVNYSAYVVYGEKLQTPMPRMIANLYNSNGVFVSSAITGTDGIFSFDNLIPGDSYSVHFSTDLEPFGVDMADAFMLLNYLYGKTQLSELQLKAADVNGDHQVNYSDFAFIISQWYLRGEDFPAGKWVLPVWTFTAPSAFKSTTGETGPDGPITIVSQSDLNQDVPPVIKEIKTVRNKIKEIAYAENQYEIELPISFVSNLKIFGMGLEMTFNNPDIEITGINSNLSDLEYVMNGNAVKLSWLSSEGQSFAANQEFIKVNVRLNSSDDVNAVLSLLSEAQFVGENGNLLGNVQLNMPQLKKSIIEASLGNPFPNPANNEISFAINQANAGSVQVEIYNLSGQLVKRLMASPQNNKITISTSDLANGSYLCSVNINAKPDVKLINVQH